jgi:myo-inositol 2-dehydrogenase / D-chiro-inositol 1-dehydrogenase
MSHHQGKVRLGIIGCGKSAEVYQMPGLRQVKDIDVIAASDIDRERLERFAERFSVKHSFVDYHEMLNCPDIQAVAVITPTRFHAETGLAAIAAGKHVFIDKPLALTISECDGLISQAAQSPGKVIMVGFNLRFHRIVSKAVRIVQSGALGEIKAIRSTYTHWHPGATAQSWHRKREFGGGVLFNEAVHHFDLWRLFLGSEVRQIFSTSRPSEYFEDETGAIAACFENGILASGIFSYESSPNNEVEIFGKMARMRLALYCMDGLEVYSNQEYPGDMRARSRRFIATMKGLPETVKAMRKGSDFDLTYRNQWQHFADCILRHSQPDCTLEDGKRSVEIALAATESASSGRLVKISYGSGPN